ncbi:MAG: DUF4982 domain-containing protein [Bacteroidales bacterium]|nr:DUF4982 domain-containing protein [Bacteroidales bacterium]
MKTRLILTAALIAAGSFAAFAQPMNREPFNDGWTFTRNGESKVVNLPHDWGVEGPFVQEYPGESGKLAWWGKAEYSRNLNVKAGQLEAGKRFYLDIDGAMSYSKVWCNGELAGEWPYGYASYQVDLTSFLKTGDNEIKVTLDNPEESSRWYPGGGLYRNVWLTVADPVGVAHWGTYVITPEVHSDYATASIKIRLRNNTGAPVSGRVESVISHGGEEVARTVTDVDDITDGKEITQGVTIRNPHHWGPFRPCHYFVTTTVTAGNYKEEYHSVFGIRKIEFRSDGFYLNGNKTFLKGVCLHHDAGALGAVWNYDAWLRRLHMLRDMGCNAIRMSHNPPAPELLDLCDRLGFMVIDELTDTWTVPKKENGYAKLFDEWAEKDLVSMIHRDRNHPSVILWSIGNECGEQGDSTKWDIPRRLTEVCHREDPTRLTTAGNDNLWAAYTDYRNTIDVYGFNYKPYAYKDFHEKYPEKPYFGSETASCVSTRGYYLFPVSQEKGEGWTLDAPYQVSSYDLYAPGWATTPAFEWSFEDDNPECAGEFVWTGFDYLGEPTPFNLDPSVLTNFHTEEEKAAAIEMFKSWGQTVSDHPLPSRSSYFGIIDLAGFPKDRYWLYLSRWRPNVPMVHILPHWNWPDRVGLVTPVHVYTSGDSVELFLNGVSLGKKEKGPKDYRLCWDDVVYEPGKLLAVAYKDGQIWATDAVETTGKPSNIDFSPEDGHGPSAGFGGLAEEFYVKSTYESIIGYDITYMDIRILDSEGRLVPDASVELTLTPSGDGELVFADAGDPTSHESFRSGKVRTVGGLASVGMRLTKKKKGTFKLRISAEGLSDVIVEVKKKGTGYRVYGRIPMFQ